MQILGTCKKRPPGASIHQPLWYLLTLWLLLHQPLAMRTPENTEENHDNTEPADEGNTQMEYSSDYLYKLR
jgi:hypothetical protein